MIEVFNVNPVNKGSLLATCDVRIAPWQLTMREVKIFEKGSNRWIGMPSREYVNSSGEKKYEEHLDWDTEAVKSRFRSQILIAIDKFLSENPELKSSPVVRENEDFPF